MSSDPPSRDDFVAAQWESCINNAAQRTCWAYHSLFGQAKQSAETNKDEFKTAIFTRLQCWMTVRMNDSDAKPFSESLLDAISEHDYLLLRELAPLATDAELRARLADLAWQGRVNNRRDPAMARLAIAAYLQSSQNFVNAWWERTPRIERALQLALSLGRRSPEVGTVWQHIESILARINGDDESLASAVLMEMMQQCGYGDATVYAPMAERAALKAEAQISEGQREKARRYWEAEANWHQVESASWLKSKKLAAETYVAGAQDEIDGLYGSQQWINAATNLQRAIESYRNINLNDRFAARIQELHGRMIEANKQARSIFSSHSHQVDIARYAQEAMQRVVGLSFESALREVVLMYSSPEIAVLEKHVEAGADELVELLASYQKVNASGQVVAHRPSLFSPDPTLRQEALTAEMFGVSSLYRQIFVQGMLIPAVHQIERDHRVSTRDWVQVIHNSPFVPADREWLFARGLQAGWEGEWDIATHLLVPQIENSIRHILTRSGAIASGLRSGVQSEQGLDVTLEKPELAQLLPENLIFDLRGLLTEQMGDYLRHKTAHGLASFKEFYSVPSFYLWWLTLSLCLLPLLSMQVQSATSPSEVAPATPENV